MKNGIIKRITALLLCFVMVMTLFPLSTLATKQPTQMQTEDNYLKLWYNEPATDWKSQALPIGNGNIGGMVFGKTEKEQVQVNELTLWSGGPNSDPAYSGGNVKDADRNLDKIQAAMFAGDYGTANSMVGELLGNKKGYLAYQNLGDIYMDFSGRARTNSPVNYHRELDLEDAVQRVSYQNDGVSFTREYFASNPGNVMVMRLKADQDDALAFKLSFAPDVSFDGHSNPSKTFTMTAENDAITCRGEIVSSKMKFATQLKVVAPNATITNNSDGTIDITAGEDVTILMTAGTNYDITEADNIREIEDFHAADGSGDYLDNNDPNGDVAAQKVAKRIAEAERLGYEKLLKTHLQDYQELFGRVSLDLGDADKANVPTDALLKQYKAARNGYLEVLLFQYGRYMLIASSRDAVLPANLQGIWNNSNTPPWKADYHFNINLQMNYWPAFVTNIAETADPLVTFMNSLRAPGNLTAREHFGVEDGWVVTTQVTPFGMTAPGWDFNWGFTPGSGAWTCNNLWDYYQFTQDPEVLKAIYPILKEGTQFWLEYLVENPNTRINGVEGTGELVTAPSGSSEHGPIGIGTTYDMSLAYMLMTDTIVAAETLNKDQAFCNQVQAALNRMYPFQIGASGQLKEWREETTYSSMPGSDPTHRHMSQLLALHPGNLITKEKTPELFDAAVKALELRGDGGTSGGTGGWSMAQKTSLWARAGDGEQALRFLELLFKGGILDNLFDDIGDFQIDGNFGATSGIAEMLIQSHDGAIQPLPALPTEWADGSYTGLVARGNFETDATWSGGNLTDFAVRSGSGNECVVRYPALNGAKVYMDGKEVAYEVLDNDTISFETRKGATYTFTELPVLLNAPRTVMANRTSADNVTVTWQAVDTAQSYRVYRKAAAGGFKCIAYDLTETQYLDETAVALTPGESFTYMIAAADTLGREGKPSLVAAIADKQTSFEIVDGKDSRVVYTGDWYHDPNDKNYYQNTCDCSWTPGAYAEFTFTGTGIELYTVAKPGMNTAEASIDGTPDPAGSCQYLPVYTPNTLVYRRFGLGEGEHTIRFTTPEFVTIPDEEKTRDTISLDYFKVYAESPAALVESVSLSAPSGVNLISESGQQLRLAAAVQPIDAVNQNLTWTVKTASGKATDLVTVDQDGMVRATEKIGRDTVKVTASANDESGVSGTFTLQVATDHTPPQEGKVNAALKKPATASAGSGADLLTDGYMDSAHGRLITTPGQADPIIVEIDFQATNVIDQVNVYERVDLKWDVTKPGGGNPRIDSVDVKAWDGGGWESIGTGGSAYEEIDNNTLKRTIACTSTETTKIQLTLHDAENQGITIWEIEALGEQKKIEWADKAELLMLLEQAALYREADFATGWDTFIAVRDAAVAQANNVEASQLAVDNAFKALQDAIGDVTVVPMLQDISVSCISSTLPVSRAMPLRVMATYDRKPPINVANLAEINTENGLISVAADGTLTGVSAGNEIISVTYTENGITKSAQTAIKITDNPAGDLAVTSTVGGRVLRDVFAPYQNGQKVTLTATANNGYYFAGWKINGTKCAENPVVVTAITGRQVEALFEKQAPSSGGSMQYTISVKQAKGGEITPNTSTVFRSESATFNIKADRGYVIKDVLVDGKSVGAVAKYTFSNVMENHAITAVFEESKETTKTFTDVNASDWYYDAVNYVVGHGLMNGTSDTTFAPQATTTRGMVVTMLYRHAGAPAVESDNASWYSAGQVWAKEFGLSDGSNMMGNITREQFATMLYRYAKELKLDATAKGDAPKFTDGDKVSDFASDAMKWAIVTGLITGKANNLLDPQGSATRAEVATMLMRFCEMQ